MTAAATLFENAADFMHESIKPDYLINNMVESSALGSITGPSGQYKSFIAIDIACCIATGKTWNGRDTKQGAVLYLAGEGRSGLKRRVIAWCMDNGMKPQELTGFYLSRNTLLMDGGNTDQIIAEMAGIDVSLIIIDTTARHLVGHENDTRDMGAYINAVDTLKGKLGAAAVMVHHTGHDQTRGRGNTAYKAALDCELMCDKGALTFSKMKDCEPPEPVEFKLKQIIIDRDDYSGEIITSCVVEYGARSFTNRQAGKVKTTSAERNLIGIISGTPGITIEDVRAEYYRRILSIVPDSKMNTLHTNFRRAVEGLIDKNLAYIDDLSIFGGQNPASGQDRTSSGQNTDLSSNPASGQWTFSGQNADLSTHTSGQDRTPLLEGCPLVQYADLKPSDIESNDNTEPAGEILNLSMADLFPEPENEELPF